MVESSEIVIQSKATAEMYVRSAQEDATSMLEGAKAQAENVINAANEQAARTMEDARIRADEAIDKANKWSAEIRVAAGDFIEEIMEKANTAIGNSYNEIQAARASIRGVTSRVETPEEVAATEE